MTTMAIFALLGLVLAMAGIYGVISNIVSQRTQEIGIRRALGARSRDIIKMVLRQGVMMVLIGVSGGMVMALVTMRLLSSQLYGVTPYDPATFLLIAGVLLLVALVACWVPARRAAQVDPLVALHYE
jgi:putative ABC transport system permease protein